jgi:hypothetical protein
METRSYAQWRCSPRHSGPRETSWLQITIPWAAALIVTAPLRGIAAIRPRPIESVADADNLAREADVGANPALANLTHRAAGAVTAEGVRAIDGADAVGQFDALAVVADLAASRVAVGVGAAAAGGRRVDAAGRRFAGVDGAGVAVVAVDRGAGGANATLAAIARGAGVAVVASGTVRLLRIGAESGRGVARPHEVALVRGGADDGVAADTPPGLTGVGLSAGIPVVAGGAVGGGSGAAPMARADGALARVGRSRALRGALATPGGGRGGAGGGEAGEEPGRGGAGGGPDEGTAGAVGGKQAGEVVEAVAVHRASSTWVGEAASAVPCRRRPGAPATW